MTFKTNIVVELAYFKILFRDVHRYIVDNGVVKIKLHLEKLKKEVSDLQL